MDGRDRRRRGVRLTARRAGRAVRAGGLRQRRAATTPPAAGGAGTRPRRGGAGRWRGGPGGRRGGAGRRQGRARQRRRRTGPAGRPALHHLHAARCAYRWTMWTRRRASAHRHGHGGRRFHRRRPAAQRRRGRAGRAGAAGAGGEVRTASSTSSAKLGRQQRRQIRTEDVTEQMRRPGRADHQRSAPGWRAPASCWPGPPRSATWCRWRTSCPAGRPTSPRWRRRRSDWRT